MENILILLLLILVIVFGPLAIIWGLNTLFPVLAIAYTFKTWFATWIIFGTGLAGKYK